MNDSPSKGVLLAKLGAWMQLAQWLGMAFTSWGMIRAFRVLGTQAPNGGDPAQLSAAIGSVLYSALAGLVIGLVGCILLTVAITSCRYRAKWVFWFLVTYGALLTPFGLFFLIYCLIKKDEFLRPVSAVAP